jgi:hypothetical protein
MTATSRGPRAQDAHCQPWVHFLCKCLIVASTRQKDVLRSGHGLGAPSCAPSEVGTEARKETPREKSGAWRRFDAGHDPAGQMVIARTPHGERRHRLARSQAGRFLSVPAIFLVVVAEVSASRCRCDCAERVDELDAKLIFGEITEEVYLRERASLADKNP